MYPIAHEKQSTNIKVSCIIKLPYILTLKLREDQDDSIARNLWPKILYTYPTRGTSDHLCTVHFSEDMHALDMDNTRLKDFL